MHSGQRPYGSSKLTGLFPAYAYRFTPPSRPMGSWVSKIPLVRPYSIARDALRRPPWPLGDQVSRPCGLCGSVQHVRGPAQPLCQPVFQQGASTLTLADDGSLLSR
jgi:hypothetical protein